MAPFAVGVYLGLRSVLKGFRGGWNGSPQTLLLGVVAIGMPIAESSLADDRLVKVFGLVRAARPVAPGRCPNRRVGRALTSPWVPAPPRILTASRPGGSVMSCPKGRADRDVRPSATGRPGREHCIEAK